MTRMGRRVAAPSGSNNCYFPGPKNGAKNVSGMPLRPSAQIGKTRFAPEVPPM